MPPSITLAMIAKNEQDNLAQCLPTIRPFVDELVLVDTGSTDNTREVAARFGANIYQFDHRNHPECFFLDNEATCRAFGYDIPGTYSGEIAFADFGAARAESFKHATGDFILWVDSDDVVEGGEHLRSIVEDLARKPNSFGFLKYDYARDDKERSFYSQWRERIVRRGAATWVNPVHEVLMPIPAAQPIVPVRYDQILLVHRRKPDRRQTPNRNYKILLRQLKADFDAKRDTDPRTLFYLGQEARFIEPTKAVGFYEQYLKLSGWGEERAAAHCALGQIYEFGQVPGLPSDEAYARANREYATAAAELDNNPDGLFGLARIAYLRGRYQDCINYSERGLKIGNTDSMLGMNPMDRLYRPHVYLNHAYAMVGRIEDAIKSCEAALSVAPDDPGVPGGSSGMVFLNLGAYKKALEKPAPVPKEDGKAVAVLGKDEDLTTPPAMLPHDAYVIWAIQLWKRAMNEKRPDKARWLLDSLPVTVLTDPKIAEMRSVTEKVFGPKPPDITHEIANIIKRATDEMAKAMDARRSVEVPERLSVVTRTPASTSTERIVNAFAGNGLNVVIWIGPAFEPWDPTTPNTKGIGGSETACIEVAKNLVAQGHRVTVYGDCEKTAGVYDGVTYRHWKTLDSVDCDVFISSRQPGIMAAIDKIRAKLRLLWVHDIHCGPNSPDMERWLLRFDRVMCLSKWHKDFLCSTYPTLHPDRVIVTRNGIDPARFASMVPKTNRLIFSSSPNRGVASLLSIFPSIRAMVPDAELHIYYGLDCWKTLAGMRNDPGELAAIQKYEDMLFEAQRNGRVYWHGRVNQAELAEAFMRSKVWLYPTLGPELFPETSCISAMEAMAAGAVPVTTAYAALIETVKHGFLIDPNDAQAAERFVNTTVDLLTNEPKRLAIAEAARKYALTNLSWAGLAKEWATDWKRLIDETGANPIAKWRSA